MRFGEEEADQYLRNSRRPLILHTMSVKVNAYLNSGGKIPVMIQTRTLDGKFCSNVQVTRLRMTYMNLYPGRIPLSAIKSAFGKIRKVLTTRGLTWDRRREEAAHLVTPMILRKTAMRCGTNRTEPHVPQSQFTIRQYEAVTKAVVANLVNHRNGACTLLPATTRCTHSQ